MIALTFAYVNERESIFNNVDLVGRSYVLLLKSVKAQQDFFSYETKREDYFASGESIYLDRYKILIDSTISTLNQVRLPDQDGLNQAILDQSKALTVSDSLFGLLIIKIVERGFKDYNLEGAMREEVHWLERSELLPTAAILSLRRHEKDYIIRNSQTYVDQLNTEVEQLMSSIEQRLSSNPDRFTEVMTHLEAYQNKFNALVDLDRLIGIKDNTGLKLTLDNQTSELEANFSDVVLQTRAWSTKEFDQLTLIFVITVIILIAASVVISAIIAQRITKPLTDLTSHITRFVDSNFTLETDHPVVKSQDEIGSLTRNFSVLKDEVISQMKFFKQKVEERTKELAQANQQLVKISEANSRFVPNEFLNRLGKAGIEDVQLGDHVEQEMTVMFSDIREFTSISEGLNPQENFDFINSYLNGIVPIIQENGGFIDKFVGDSVMALFPGPPDRAISAALEFEKFLLDFNEQLAQADKAPIEIGTGFHTGDLILGTIGHNQRLETTVISDAVNTASRIEGLTKHYGAKTIFTENTRKKLQDTSFFHWRYLDKVRVKGKSNTLPIYELIGYSDMLKIDSLASYNRGIELLKQQKIVDAADLFRKLKQQNPADKGVSILLKKCEDHLNSSDQIWNDETHMVNK